MNFTWLCIKHPLCHEQATCEESGSAATLTTSARNNRESSVSFWTAQERNNWEFDRCPSHERQEGAGTGDPFVPKLMTWLTLTAERETPLHPLPICLGLSAHRSNESSIRHVYLRELWWVGDTPENRDRRRGSTAMLYQNNSAHPSLKKDLHLTYHHLIKLFWLTC